MYPNFPGVKCCKNRKENLLSRVLSKSLNQETKKKRTELLFCFVVFFCQKNLLLSSSWRLREVWFPQSRSDYLGLLKSIFGMSRFGRLHRNQAPVLVDSSIYRKNLGHIHWMMQLLSLILIQLESDLSSEQVIHVLSNWGLPINSYAVLLKVELFEICSTVILS